MTLVILFIFGICVGSFLNVVIDRIPAGKSIVIGRSQCDFCKKTLAWYDLVPLFSFLFLRGRCRYCNKKLSWQYPIVEFCTGLLFVGLFLFMSSMPQFQLVLFITELILFVSAFALTVMDIKLHILSDKVLIVFALASFVQVLFLYPTEIFLRLGIGLLSCLPFFCLFFFSRGKAMGFGDVKLSLVLGFVLGFPNIIIAYYCAFLTGGLVAIILILRGKKKLHGGTIAFGPFLFLGFALATLYGNILWTCVKHFIGF